MKPRFELWSKLLVSPLITPLLLACVMPYITPLRNLDYSLFEVQGATPLEAATAARYPWPSHKESSHIGKQSRKELGIRIRGFWSLEKLKREVLFTHKGPPGPGAMRWL